jgi:hypothetical protein
MNNAGCWTGVFLIIAVVAVPLIFPSTFLSMHPVKTPVKAESYVWSAACPQAEYNDRDAIPVGCQREEYRITNPEDYPIEFVDTEKAFPFYRVGNEIVSIQCKAWKPSECIVWHSLPNAFTQ